MQRFIVGTGRCGSTLLSRMLALNDYVLSLFEVFAGLDRNSFLNLSPIEGDEFETILSHENAVIDTVLTRGFTVDEITYPFGNGMRYKEPGSMPWLLAACVPGLSDEPDKLYEEILSFARSQPSQTFGEHFEVLFNWLRDLNGKACWVERSGGIIEAVDSLNQQFDDAKFCHIHRDPCEAALSYREHALGRMAPTVFFGWLPENIGNDPVQAILDSSPPAEYFGRFITRQLAEGYRALATLNASQYIEVTFEDLTLKPKETLKTIAEFFEMDQPSDWLTRAEQLSRGLPATRFESLTEGEQDRLSKSCEPANSLLGRTPRLWDAINESRAFSD